MTNANEVKEHRLTFLAVNAVLSMSEKEQEEEVFS